MNEKQDSHKVKPFTKQDWDGYAGAEPFSDGSEPLISYNFKISDWVEKTNDMYFDDPVDYVVIIADKNGIGICGMDSFMCMDIANRYVATVFANELLGHTWKVGDLLKIGFRLV